MCSWSLGGAGKSVEIASWGGYDLHFWDLNLQRCFEAAELDSLAFMISFPLRCLCVTAKDFATRFWSSSGLKSRSVLAFRSVFFFLISFSSLSIGVRSDAMHSDKG